jgi:DnaJ family protein C protein 11
MLQADLPGFFDPCFGEDKKLFIRYSFRNQTSSTTKHDREPVSLPED